MSKNAYKYGHIAKFKSSCTNLYTTLLDLTIAPHFYAFLRREVGYGHIAEKENSCDRLYTTFSFQTIAPYFYAFLRREVGAVILLMVVLGVRF